MIYKDGNLNCSCKFLPPSLVAVGELFAQREVQFKWRLVGDVTAKPLAFISAVKLLFVLVLVLNIRTALCGTDAC